MSRLARGIPAATRIQGSPSPLAVGICLVAAMLALAVAPAARAVEVGGWDGFDFETNAFADFVYDWVGPWGGVGGPGALTGSEVDDYGSCEGLECKVTVEFYDNIMLDLEGPDLAVFQLGLPDTFGVRIAGTTIVYDALDIEDTGVDVSVYMGPEVGYVDFDLLVAQIDIVDFFEAPGGSATVLELFSDPYGGETTSPADFTVIASMNIVPEPSTALLLAIGLVGLAINGRRPRA